MNIESLSLEKLTHTENSKPFRSLATKGIFQTNLIEISLPFIFFILELILAFFRLTLFQNRLRFFSIQYKLPHGDKLRRKKQNNLHILLFLSQVIETMGAAILQTSRALKRVSRPHNITLRSVAA